MKVLGQKGKNITWKSTCSGYKNTIIDNEDEKIYFQCTEGAADLIIKDLKFNRESDRMATIEFDVVNIGQEDTENEFAIAVFINGELKTHTLIADEISPGQDHHKSLSNYYWLNPEIEYEIKIIADYFDESDDNPVYENINNDEINEENEANNHAIINIKPGMEYEADLSNFPELFFNNGIFNGYIVVGDNAPASDVIAAVDIAKSLNHDSTVGSTKLASEISDPSNMNLISIGNPCNNAITDYLMGNPSYCTKHFDDGEGKIKLYNYNKHYQLIVAGHSDYDTRQAAKVLANWNYYDLTGSEYSVYSTSNGTSIVEEEEYTAEPIVYNPENPSTIEVTPDIPVDTSACNGCTVNGACISFGTRLVENGQTKYCDITKALNLQKNKDDSCQNNYECTTNQCNDGKCGSLMEELQKTRGLLQKVINWFNGLFN